MTIDAASGYPSDSAAATAAATTAAKAKSTGSADLDKDAFLKLLVAQLKYQNPLSPMDGKEFLAQSAQFAVVEKLEAMAKAQTDLGNWQKAIAGEGMVGKQVTSTNGAGTKVTGVVTGMTLTASGPRLVLAGGGTMAVDDVDEVSAAPSTTGTPTGTTTAPGTSSGSGAGSA